MNQSGTGERIESMLTTALGEVAGQLLQDDSIVELMLNHDGRLWVDRLGEGRSESGHTISSKDAERAIFIVASSIKTICNKDKPILSAELPGSGFRFQGLLPPLVERPVFTIRKKALKIFSLSDYVVQGTMTNQEKRIIEQSVCLKRNILIVGGTGSGKTTLANAILAEISKTEDRIIIIEDTKELQCTAKDYVPLRTKDGTATMTDLLKATMRLRPDRIVIGEVRGPEALALLKAWNTGHPGGCATVHADSAKKGLTRLEQLIEEAGVRPSPQLIADAVNLVIYIEKTATGRIVRDLASVEFSNGQYLLTRPAKKGQENGRNEETFGENERLIDRGTSFSTNCVIE